MSWHENPFWILALPTHATLGEVRVAARALRGKLRVGSKAATTYDTPLGKFERSEELIVWAESELETPAKRAAYGILADTMPKVTSGAKTSHHEPRAKRWWARQ